MSLTTTRRFSTASALGRLVKRMSKDSTAFIDYLGAVSPVLIRRPVMAKGTAWEHNFLFTKCGSGVCPNCDAWLFERYREKSRHKPDGELSLSNYSEVSKNG